MKEEIIIRKAKFGDAKDVAEYFNLGIKLKNFKYMRTDKPWDKKKIKEVDEKYKNKKCPMIALVAEEKETGKIIGNALFRYQENCAVSHVGSCGWSVHPNYQGRGIATKLLNELIKEAKKAGIKRLEAEVVVDNVTSIKLAEKCGFKIEGKMKKAFMLGKGKYADMYILGRII